MYAFSPMRRLTWDADDITVSVDLMCWGNQLECGTLILPAITSAPSANAPLDLAYGPD
jgi:hypothetical protein